MSRNPIPHISPYVKLIATALTQSFPNDCCTSQVILRHTNLLTKNILTHNYQGVANIKASYSWENNV